MLLDLARKVQYFTLNIITDIAFRQALGDLVRDEDTHSSNYSKVN